VRAGSREQGAGSRGQGAWSRGSRKAGGQGAGSMRKSEAEKLKICRLLFGPDELNYFNLKKKRCISRYYGMVIAIIVIIAISACSVCQA